MYRARARRDNGSSEVRGPNSALTQFLREQGISAENIRERWLESQQNKKNEKEQKREDSSATESDIDLNGGSLISEGDESEKSEDETVDDNEWAAGADDRLRRLRESRGESDSDEEAEQDIISPRRRQKRSVMTSDGNLNSQKTIQQHTMRKRRKQKAANLLDKRGKMISSLQDMCIDTITKSIIKHTEENLVQHIRDSLGGISFENFNKLAKALSKNRALNDSTLQLFLNTKLRTLTFHDCSKISYDGYKQLAIFSPHLESLSLQMCGQLNNEALLYLAQKLSNLREIYLDGPFLINADTWSKFFNLMKGRLETFHIGNTHRFSDQSLSALLSNCGSTLKSLRLSTLDSVTNYSLLPQYLSASDYHTLMIENPSSETDVNDEVLINILGAVGKNLKHLSLNGCTGLTDEFIVNGLLPFLSNAGTSSLDTLKLEDLDQITSDGIVTLFSSLKFPELKTCSFKRCIRLDDASMIELLLCCRPTIEKLNLNSLKLLSAKSFSFMHCPNLKTLNVGFVRCMSDELVQEIVTQNSSLSIIEVYGDNKVTAKCKVRRDVIIIGRQSDSI